MNMARGFLVPAEHGTALIWMNRSALAASFWDMYMVYGCWVTSMRCVPPGQEGQKLVEVLEAFHLHAVDFFHNGGAHLGVSQCSLGGQGHQEDHDFIHAFFRMSSFF